MSPKYSNNFFILCQKLIDVHSDITVNGLSTFLEVARTTLRRGLERIKDVDVENTNIDEDVISNIVGLYMQNRHEYTISDFMESDELYNLYNIDISEESIDKQMSLPYDGPLLKEKTINLDDDNKLLNGEEITDYAQRLARKTQRNQDINRLERGLFRKNTRDINALEEYSKNIENLLNNHNLSSLTIHHNVKKDERIGVVQLSDLHLNEVVSLNSNQYNLKIASQRLQKFIYECKTILNAQGVKRVLVAFTGDILNSNRRADELLLNATNRANATFIAVDILQQLLLDLNNDFNIVCANVTGNESRIEKDIGWINDVTQDNFDFMIYNMLAKIFRGSKGIQFLSPDDTYLEKVVSLYDNFNILLMHGHNGFARDTDKKIASKVGQYAQKGILIDYIIFGHIHSAQINDLYGRSSGLPGSNNYSYNALDLPGKASQNLYVVTCNKDIHGFKIDLQTTDGYNGYDYDDGLDYIDSFKK